jgi:hypothetical protein
MIYDAHVPWEQGMKPKSFIRNLMRNLFIKTISRKHIKMLAERANQEKFCMMLNK